MKRAVPVLVSAALVSWLVWRVSPEALARAGRLLEWQRLAVLTGGLVLALYFWDAVCLWWLFTEPDRPLRFGAVLHARGSSYLWSALNYELGQGTLAWELARAQGVLLASALGTCLLLAYHDLGVLLALGLAGSLLRADPRSLAARWFCGAGLGLLLGLGLLAGLLPPGWRSVWGKARGRLGPSAWSWRRSARLGLLRSGYYGLMVIYAGLALPACGAGVESRAAWSATPLVVLADGLPLSVSGLGTRETALLYLLDPKQPATLLAFSLIWSTGLMVGRLLLGLGHRWLIPAGRRNGPGERRPRTSEVSEDFGSLAAEADDSGSP